jgi:hypothetical protein
MLLVMSIVEPVELEKIPLLTGDQVLLDETGLVEAFILKGAGKLQSIRGKLANSCMRRSPQVNLPLPLRFLHESSRLAINIDGSLQAITEFGIDTPLRHADGKLVWDHPEHVPNYLKNAAAAEMHRRFNEENMRYKNDLFRG